MVFLDVGVGDRPTIGVRVDQQDLPTRRRGLEGELVEAFSQLVCDKRPPAEAGGGDGREGLVRMVPLYVKRLVGLPTKPGRR